MAFQFTVYSAVYFGGAAAAVAAAIVVWGRRSAPGGLWLFLMLLSAAWWCLFDALESCAIGIPSHVLWAQIAYLGIMTVGTFLLLFSVEYTGRRRPSRIAIAALFVVPALSILAVATNAWHRQIWTGFSIVAGGTNLVLYSHGWLYWVLALYQYAVALFASVILVGFALRAKSTFRLQSLTVIAAVAIPVLAEIVYGLAPDFLPGVDPSVTIAISGVLLALSLLQFRLLDLTPVAREKLVERMEHGLLVLDAKSRVLDANPAASQILGSAQKSMIGLDVRSALPRWPEVANYLAEGECDDKDVSLVSPDGRSVSVGVVPLEDMAGECGGSLATLRDITKQVEVDAALQTANADLRLRVAEIEGLHEELREQAIRDPLTGLYNRRYLDETLKRELGRADREGYPVSIVMVDVDRFKDINDDHGHAAGDQVLRFLGAQFRAETRPGDIACRYGGDEFLMVLPNTPIAAAYARAEAWRETVEESSVYWLEWSESTTLSLGVAGFPDHGSTPGEVMMAADTAVYQAKGAGRDRTVLAATPSPSVGTE